MSDYFIERLEEQRDRIDELKKQERFGPEFKVWKSETLRLIEQIWGSGSSYYNDFTKIQYGPYTASTSTPDSEFQEFYLEGLDTAKKMLESFIREYKKTPVSKDLREAQEKLLWIENLLERFDAVAKQLIRRQRGREPIRINDEYDVQDLLHALLKIRFDDIRPEEWTPSYAGGSSKIDFLLKGTGIVIETKKTRKSLTEKEIGKELIIDIANYQKHPECEVLVCFIYDPDFILSNPYGLENDLTKKHEGINVKTFVFPK